MAIANQLPTNVPLYPDVVTMKRIDLANKKSTTDNYWTKSTQQALSKALQPIGLNEAKEILCVGHNGWAPDYLDILHEKAPNAHITVVDTQAKQIETMKNYFEDNSPKTPAENYTLLTTANFTKPPETLYDLVLLYHLTNHIPTDVAEDFCNIMKHWLTDKGSIALMGSYLSTSSSSQFTVRHIQDGELVSKATDSTKFNAKLKNSDTLNPKAKGANYLPTRLLNKGGLETIFNDLDLPLQAIIPFHYKRANLETEANLQDSLTGLQIKEQFQELDQQKGDDIIAIGTKLNVEA